MNESVRDQLARLREAATTGAVAELCQRHDVDLLVVFGSVLGETSDPRDLDLAIRFGSSNETPEPLTILDDLYRLTGSERIDLMVLNRAAPLARERALTTGEPLFQARPATSPTPRSRQSWNAWTQTSSARWILS